MKFVRAYHICILFFMIVMVFVAIYYMRRVKPMGMIRKVNSEEMLKINIDPDIESPVYEKVKAVEVIKPSIVSEINTKEITETIKKTKISNNTYRKPKKLNPTPKKVDFNIGFNTAAEAEEFYYKTITKNTVNCVSHERLGRQDDGGWDICTDGGFRLKSPCLSYSFGVNYIWEFDDEIATKYQCTVRTFDPSMTREADQFQRPSKVWFYKIGLGKEDTTWSNGWSIMKMSSILKKFNEENQVIDILKIDIEYSEWDSFESMIKEGLLAKVKQIMFETHTEEVQGRTTTKESFVRYLRMWNNLYEAGFRQWKNSWNHFGNYFSRHTNTQRTCCYEHYLININYM